MCTNLREIVYICVLKKTKQPYALKLKSLFLKYFSVKKSEGRENYNGISVEMLLRIPSSPNEESTKTVY